MTLAPCTQQMTPTARPVARARRTAVSQPMAVHAHAFLRVSGTHPSDAPKTAPRSSRVVENIRMRESSNRSLVVDSPSRNCMLDCPAMTSTSPIMTSRTT